MSKKIVDEIKEVVKKRKKKKNENPTEVSAIEALMDTVRTLMNAVEIQDRLFDEQSKRIDRIIEAIDKSRPVRGL